MSQTGSLSGEPAFIIPNPGTHSPKWKTAIINVIDYTRAFPALMCQNVYRGKKDVWRLHGDPQQYELFDLLFWMVQQFKRLPSILFFFISIKLNLKTTLPAVTSNCEFSSFLFNRVTRFKVRQQHLFISICLMLLCSSWWFRQTGLCHL